MPVHALLSVYTLQLESNQRPPNVYKRRMCAQSLFVFTALCGVLLVSQLVGANETLYMGIWAVEVHGGPEAAKEIARRHGFVSRGKVRQIVYWSWPQREKIIIIGEVFWAVVQTARSNLRSQVTKLQSLNSERQISQGRRYQGYGNNIIIVVTDTRHGNKLPFLSNFPSSIRYWWPAKAVDSTTTSYHNQYIPQIVLLLAITTSIYRHDYTTMRNDWTIQVYPGPGSISQVQCRQLCIVFGENRTDYVTI